ncbi:NAD(P)-binding Rossmann-fold containing protein [Glarea lozoyensis ATCC 20868]|uniref:NAD(P)-binding Rossmann-fold containing protein n=1 Tax=Glarea lozoyensis (strain ATCC 20868 / MF5171) TaxID=1116229 RepID=S3D926_GLAL2|nr:NAD(P)-binding Rossmann-fold containing protein [Glarea lozoyensis ATCC 20868]EPE33634.1 NAD(P)-binding Rossmann-fold containing protein [Glarea lozoyensis ATCC 20868]
MLALTSPTGKLGSSILTSLLNHNLIPPTQLLLLSSSTPTPKLQPYIDQGIQVRPLNYHSPAPSAFEGVTKLLLISTPEIALDYHYPDTPGRESVQIETLKCAIAAGVKHIYYTSLAFGSPSEAGVMRAHLRTEEFLAQQSGVQVTILRQGLYNESWPLYLGYYDPHDDERGEVVLAGNGKVSWTAISDLGLANALVLAGKDEDWAGKTLYLSAQRNALSMAEVAKLVGQERGKEVTVKVVGREEYVKCCVERGVEKDNVEWWSTTYAALRKGECLIEDGTLERLLKVQGVEVTRMEDTIKKMVGGSA